MQNGERAALSPVVIVKTTANATSSRACADGANLLYLLSSSGEFIIRVGARDTRSARDNTPYDVWTPLPDTRRADVQNIGNA